LSASWEQSTLEPGVQITVLNIIGKMRLNLKKVKVPHNWPRWPKGFQVG